MIPALGAPHTAGGPGFKSRSGPLSFWSVLFLDGTCRLAVARGARSSSVWEFIGCLRCVVVNRGFRQWNRVTWLRVNARPRNAKPKPLGGAPSSAITLNIQHPTSSLLHGLLFGLSFRPLFFRWHFDSRSWSSIERSIFDYPVPSGWALPPTSEMA
jgi:hypothetical protein